MIGHFLLTLRCLRYLRCVACVRQLETALYSHQVTSISDQPSFFCVDKDTKRYTAQPEVMTEPQRLCDNRTRVEDTRFCQHAGFLEPRGVRTLYCVSQSITTWAIKSKLPCVSKELVVFNNLMIFIFCRKMFKLPLAISLSIWVGQGKKTPLCTQEKWGIIFRISWYLVSISKLLKHIDSDETSDRIASSGRLMYAQTSADIEWKEGQAVTTTCRIVIKRVQKFVLTAHGGHTEHLVWNLVQLFQAILWRC